MKIKNILKKLGSSQPETRNSKPETESSQPHPSLPEQSPPPNNSLAKNPTAVDLGENAGDLEDRVNRQSKIVNSTDQRPVTCTCYGFFLASYFRRNFTNRSPGSLCSLRCLSVKNPEGLQFFLAALWVYCILFQF
jgi:hypothetical protein